VLLSACCGTASTAKSALCWGSKKEEEEKEEDAAKQWFDAIAKQTGERVRLSLSLFDCRAVCELQEQK